MVGLFFDLVLKLYSSGIYFAHNKIYPDFNIRLKLVENEKIKERGNQ